MLPDDDIEVELQDLAVEEIQELLLEAGTEITAEQAEQLARFVAEAGGMEEALAALNLLAHERPAA